MAGFKASTCNKLNLNSRSWLKACIINLNVTHCCMTRLAMFCHCVGPLNVISVFNAAGGNPDCFMLRSSNPPFSICNCSTCACPPTPSPPRRLTMFPTKTNAQCYCCNGPKVLKAMKLNTPFLTFIHTQHVCYYLHLALGPSQNL